MPIQKYSTVIAIGEMSGTALNSAEEDRPGYYEYI
jgi:hypothetical protein